MKLLLKLRLNYSLKKRKHLFLEEEVVSLINQPPLSPHHYLRLHHNIRDKLKMKLKRPEIHYLRINNLKVKKKYWEWELARALNYL